MSQGGFLIPKQYVQLKRGWWPRLLRRIGTIIFLKGCVISYPHAELLAHFNRMKGHSS